MRSRRLSGPQKLTERVFTAARETYTAVWNHMRDRLETEVPRREVEYYAAVVAGRPGQTGAVLKIGQVEATVKKAIKATNEEYGPKGGFK
jgi:hypothetical protein